MAKSPPKKPQKTITRSGFGDTGEANPGNATGPRNAAGGPGGGKSGSGKSGSGMKRSHKIALGATGIILAGAWLGSGSNERVTPAPAETGAEAKIYASLDECLKANRPLMPRLNADGTFAPEQKGPEQLACERDFNAATYNHVSTAPKFANQGECETQYGAGQCRSTTFNGASVFIPAMVGFMVANTLANQRNPQALLPPRQQGAVPCPPGVTPAQQPGCLVPRQSSSSSSSSSGGWRSWSTSSGHTVSRDTSKPANAATKVPSGAALAPAARTSLGAAPARSASAIRSSSTTSRSGFGSTSRSIFRSSSS